MKGLKIIPMFAGLLFLSYLGVLFVRNNPDEVIVRFAGAESPAMALGFVILTSILVGMVVAGALCSVEMLMLYVQTQRLKRRLAGVAPLTPSTLLDSALNSQWEEEELEEYEAEAETQTEAQKTASTPPEKPTPKKKKKAEKDEKAPPVKSTVPPTP